jgi:DNA-binding transcriptional LysR family regulator
LNIKFSLDALQVLDAIERTGSFAAAAKALNRVPSAVTYAIQQLESSLDLALFDRTGHRARLTQAGKELLDESRYLLQSAQTLQDRARQIAHGWEAELRIAVDSIIGAEHLFPLVQRFYAEHQTPAVSTRIKLLEEVLGGAWDALVSRRADMVIGASGETPPGGGYTVLPLMHVPFVFAVAPDHPITREAQPLSDSTIRRYRAISVSDSSRSLAPRSAGLLQGQDTLTVPTMRAKVAAHVAGLGVGYLPAFLAAPALMCKTLVELNVRGGKPVGHLVTAYRPHKTGNALQWFAQQLKQPGWANALLK